MTAVMSIDSRIVSDFPEIFAEFRGKRFKILWRGSSDGFKAKEFHRRCDGHTNTLTVILDTKGNIFGGFTPVEWESRVWNGKVGKDNNCRKADDSLKSFVFTLKNPHNIPARRFALKAERKNCAIDCDSECGPYFYDIGVFDNCNTGTGNKTPLGNFYTNDTGLDGGDVFTGWPGIFQVQEIEVFEITVPLVDSQIISGFPEIFAEFRKKRFEILWRGSSDGFKAQEFHGRCDGHANTLTVILDTKGNIFGGFTPVEWESRVWNGKYRENNNCFKGDDSLKSFLFTLKNPHNIPARRFALKAEEKHRAIYCISDWGPGFGCGADIIVSDNCNANTDSRTYLGESYTNDTGLRGRIVFTGSEEFQVKEIEVFEISA